MPFRHLNVRGRDAIGPGLSSYVIAEIGTNHNQSLATATTMLEELARTGCDCAKFQIYEPDEIVSTSVRASDYGFERFYGDISAREMFERHLKTPKAWFPELQRVCHSLGMDFSATIHGADGLRWAREIGLDIVKIASMDHTNIPFLERLAGAVDAPILLSVGMAGLEDIDAAVTAITGHRAGIGLFHCCSIYPAPPEHVRLPNISFLQHRFQCPVGFSDHTLGVEAALEARRAGAVVFEKHVTLDSAQPGPDHSFAMEMEPFAAYVAALKATPVLGPPGESAVAFVQPSPAETRNRVVALKSLIVRRGLPAGHVLSADDVYMARPGTGVSPAALAQVVGRRLARAVVGEVPLQWDDLDTRGRPVPESSVS